MPALIEAIDRVIEANSAVRKRRALAKLERSLTVAMTKAFTAEGKAFLTRLGRLESRFPPAVREVAEPINWQPLFDEAALSTLNAFVQPIDEFTARALAAGMIAGVADLSVETSFTLEHPAAVDYLRDRGATQVARIRETTRDGIRSILSQAAEEGWSYERTARAIRERYAEFSRSRAKNIAVFELGDAYEHGNMLVGKELQSAGLTMQKAWLSVKDARVRPEHRENDDAGWIALDDTFPSGNDRPPTDPRCRCTLLQRRKPDGPEP